MEVDYYGWALALGVGWQGWNNVSYCSVTIVLSGFLYVTELQSNKIQTLFHPCQPTPKTSAHP